MILKKPYGFLIKHFKLIHLCLSVLAIYIFIKSINIYTFFNTYIKNDYHVTSYSGFSLQYVPIFLFLAVLISFLALILIVLMFEEKKKPNKLYQLCFSYYFIFFILLFIIKSILSSFEISVIEAETARIYRDLSLIISLPQVPILALFLLRTFGFNIKKFEFEKELKELQVSESDSEEFEININHEGYKLLRTLRRFKREFSYYVVENKLLFTIFCIIVSLSIIYFVIGGIPKSYTNNYSEKKQFDYNGLLVTVKDSMVTNLNYNGKVIDKNYYIVLKVNITNNYTDSMTFNSKNFRLELNNEYLYPVFDKSSNFIDYANDFYGKNIMANTSYDYALVYKISEKDIKSNYKIKIYRGSESKKDKMVDLFDFINIKPDLRKKVKPNGVGRVKDNLSFESTDLGNTSVQINSYEITDRYDYTYDYCVTKDDCRKFQDFVVLSFNDTDRTLIALNYKYSLDKKSAYAIRYKTFNKFVEDFMGIKYKDNEENYKYSKVMNLTPNNLNDTVVLEADKSIKDAKELAVAFTIRDQEFLVNLK